MSRHSKNNTAHSVFTYAEKKMLANEYGTMKTRLGQDSQRKFEQCHLCLKTVKDPVVCGKGHIFCKHCIMENLLTQKKEIKKAEKRFQEMTEAEEFRNVLKKREIQQLQVSEFEKDTLELGSLKKLKLYREKIERDTGFDNEDKRKYKDKLLVKAITNQTTLALDDQELKKDLIQSSFWMAESDRSRVAALQAVKLEKKPKKPSRKMICPADGEHRIKIKTLYPMKFKNGYICFTCGKGMCFQKSVFLRTCGHSHCLKCFQDFCGGNRKEKNRACQCGLPYLLGDVIGLEEAKSAFADHNEVISKVYQPAFAI